MAACALHGRQRPATSRVDASVLPRLQWSNVSAGNHPVAVQFVGAVGGDVYSFQDEPVCPRRAEPIGRSGHHRLPPLLPHEGGYHPVRGTRIMGIPCRMVFRAARER